MARRNSLGHSHLASASSADAFGVVLDHALSNVKTVLLQEYTRSLNLQERSQALSTCIHAGKLTDPVKSPPQDSKVKEIYAEPIGKFDGERENSKATTDANGSDILEVISSDSPNSVRDSTEHFADKRSRLTPLRERAAEAAEAYGHDLDMHTRARLHLLSAMQTRSKGKGSRIAGAIASFCVIGYRHPLVGVDAIMAIVIILNAIVIGASSDTSDWQGWIVFDTVFCFFFLFECLMKLSILGLRKYLCGPDWSWQAFEVVLLVTSMLEVFLAILAAGDDSFRGSSLFRIFRLARLMKILRLCRLQFISDLILMINGVIGGLRTLFWAMVSMSLPIYLVALIFRETLGQEANQDGGAHGAGSFSTLSKSFFNVFRCVVAMDCADERGRPIFVLVSERHHWFYGVIYGFTVVMMTFGLFNVIIAIYVENTVAAAKHNEMKQKEARLRNQQMFKEKIVQLAILAYSLKNSLDIGDILHHQIDMEEIYKMEIMQEEWHEKICDNQEFSDLLGELDIAPADQKGLFDALDVDNSGSLDIDELVHGIKKLRGDARKSDVVTVILTVHRVTQMLDLVLAALDKHTGMLQHLLHTRNTGLRTAAADGEGEGSIVLRRRSPIGRIAELVEM